MMPSSAPNAASCALYIPGKKLEQPVVVPDRPWEGNRIYIYGTVHYDADAQQFRMWYLTRLGRGQQHRAPGLRERQGDMIPLRHIC